MKRFVICILALTVFAAVAANAIPAWPYVEYSDSIGLSTTNWNSSVSLPKFDTSLGTLQYIEFFLGGHVEGTAKFESKDAAPATVTMNLQANIMLMRPDSTILLVTIPFALTVDNVPEWDGADDYLGPSGRTYEGLSGNKQESTTSSTPADLALFSGSGSIILPVSALGTSYGSGAGNLLLQFSTSASADAKVRYYYEPVPEPSSLIALFTGLTGIAGLVGSRRKR